MEASLLGTLRLSPRPTRLDGFSRTSLLYGTCTMQRRLGVDTLDESFDEDKVRAAAETSFTDSGLDFPLGSSPESWGHRKSDSFRKPLALQPPILIRAKIPGTNSKGSGRTIRVFASKAKEEGRLSKT
jgi:hypothetical protein